jgi:hypothetical protein
MVMGLLSMEIVLGLHCNNRQKLKVGLRIAFLLDFPSKDHDHSHKKGLKIEIQHYLYQLQLFFARSETFKALFQS